MSRGTWRGRTVALKETRDGSADAAAMANEVALYTLLRGKPHPNILTVHGVCTDCPDGKQRLVMAWCEEGSLESVLRKAAPEVRSACECGPLWCHCFLWTRRVPSSCRAASPWGLC